MTHQQIIKIMNAYVHKGGRYRERLEETETVERIACAPPQIKRVPFALLYQKGAEQTKQIRQPLHICNVMCLSAYYVLP